MCIRDRSRALSDARKYPAIDRIDSTSKYPSLLQKEEVAYLLELLRDGKSIASNILLMGEKGITDDTYIRYQKSELLDAVFLQQNSFDEVDGVSNPIRLRTMSDMVLKIIDTPLVIKGKEDIRTHFNFVRQAFLDWNYMKIDDDRFEQQKTKLLNLVKQRAYATEDL